MRPTPVFYPGEFHGLYSPWGRKELARLSDFHFQYSLKSGSLIPPALFSFLKLLYLFRVFDISIKIVNFLSSMSVKNTIDSLFGIALMQLLQVVFIFTMLILPIQEHAMALHMFVSSFFSFISILQFLSTGHRYCLSP